MYNSATVCQVSDVGSWRTVTSNLSCFNIFSDSITKVMEVEPTIKVIYCRTAEHHCVFLSTIWKHQATELMKNNVQHCGTQMAFRLSLLQVLS